MKKKAKLSVEEVLSESTKIVEVYEEIIDKQGRDLDVIREENVRLNGRLKQALATIAKLLHYIPVAGKHLIN